MLKRIAVFSLLLITLVTPSTANAQTEVGAQSFEYDGVYLTQENDRLIKGFEFDKDQELIKVIVNHQGDRNRERIDLLHQLSVQGMDLYVLSNLNPTDTSEKMQENFQKFQKRYSYDTKAVYQEVSQLIEPGMKREAVTFLLQERIPGVYQHQDFYLISQPYIYLSQNLWIVEALGTRVLRFELSNDLEEITDDFGVSYLREDDN